MGTGHGRSGMFWAFVCARKSGCCCGEGGGALRPLCSVSGRVWPRPLCCLVGLAPHPRPLPGGGRGLDQGWPLAIALTRIGSWRIVDREQARSYRVGVALKPFQQQLGVSAKLSEAALGVCQVGAPERTAVRDGGRLGGQQRAVRSDSCVS